MKIISVNKFYWKKGGSEAVFFGEKELLESHGNVVIPFSMQNERNNTTPYSHYFIDEVDYSKAGLAAKLSAAMKVIYSFDSKRKIKGLLDDEEIDVAHFHIFQHQISPSVFGPLRGRNIPIVLTLHDLKPICPNYKMYTHSRVCEECKGRKFYNCVINKCTQNSTFKSMVNMIEMYLHYAFGYYQNVDKFIAVSKFYRDKMIEFGFDSDQVVHVPNFIDSGKFDVSERDDGYALYFGRLSEEKGVETILNACKQCPNIPLVVVGGGPLESELRQRSEDMQLKNVNFVGFKGGKELTDLVAGSSFTILPSEWYENCPMSVLESFAYGKPVIGSRIGGIPELINEDHDGLTFTPGNSQDLAVKMTELWGDKKKRRTMGLNGRRKIEADFSPEKHYENLLSVYRSVL